MSKAERIGVRLSAALRARLAEAGEYAAVARALLIIGLHAAGQDVSTLRGEAAAALRGVSDPAVQAALLRLLVTAGSPVVQPMLNGGSPVVQPMLNGGSPVVQPMLNGSSPSVQAMVNDGSPLAEDAALAAEGIAEDDPFANVGIAV